MKGNGRTLVFAVLIASAAGGVFSADEMLGPGPNLAEPQKLLPVRPENAQTLQQAEEAYRLALPLVQKFANLRQSNPGALRTEAGAIGNANVAIRQLRRAAQRLIIAGEPSGMDLELRTAELERELLMVVQAVKQQPNVLQQLSVSLIKDLMPAAAKQARKLTKLGQDFRAGKLEESERDLYQMLDELEKMGVWYDAMQREGPFQPFTVAERDINARMVEVRRAAARQELLELRRKNEPQFEALLAEIAAASDALSRSPQVPAGGNNVSGPQALAYFIEQWKALQLATLRCRGYDWVRSHVTATRVPELGTLETSHQKFNAAILPALAALVDADAARPGPTDAGLYTQYLEVLAAVVPMCPAGSVGDAFRPALSRLAAKNPEFAAYVENYRAATSDLLRWRRRTAQAFAAGAMQKSQPLAQAVTTACGPDGPSPGMIDGSLQKGLRMKAAIPILLAGVKRLVDQDVYVQNVLGQGAAPGAAASGYDQRVMAVMPPLAKLLSGYYPILQYDLLVTDRLPPLTLEATVALQQAEHGDAVAVGGKVTELTLDGYATFFTGQKDFAGGGVRLGPLPADEMPDDTNRQLVMTCKLQPVWLQSELFFIQVP